MKACQTGQREIVELLLKQANSQEIISSKDQQGENGFMKACQTEQRNIVHVLL